MKRPQYRSSGQLTVDNNDLMPAPDYCPHYYINGKVISGVYQKSLKDCCSYNTLFNRFEPILKSVIMAPNRIPTTTPISKTEKKHR